MLSRRLLEVHAMRTAATLAVIAICSLSISAHQTDTEKPRTPKKGDTVQIKGCLRGSSVEAANLMTVDAEGETRVQDDIPVLTYRLQGEKKLLKDLKEKHDRRIVTVKGILRSELTHKGMGTTIGRTRIMIGSDPRDTHSGEAPLPVLEATSFEGLAVSCAR
jgi:hypothetical protein